MLAVTQQDCVRLGQTNLLDQPDTDILLQRAVDQVNALCFGRLAGTLTPYQAETVKKAVCRHADFMLTYGQALEAPLESYGINGVSISFAADKVFSQGGTTTSREVYSLMLSTGLLYRGCVG